VAALTGTAPEHPEYDDGRLNSPAARRNRAALTQALSTLAPPQGTALEIASGTGQHVIRFAPAMPGLTWQPSDPDPSRRASITAWVAAEPSANILPPITLDACAPGWAAHHNTYDLIFLANLLHLIPNPQAQTCLTEIAHALRPGGLAVVYGPFLRNGVATSEGDIIFDANIRTTTPGAGYKDLEWVRNHWTNLRLLPAQPIYMPANNLLLCARKLA